MPNDPTSLRPSEGTDGPGYPQRNPDEQSPLQARAAFIKNRPWQSVVSFNQGACSRGKAVHGLNSETGEACAEEWESARNNEVTVLEFFDFLLSFHRKAPFLFFNGNTFADMARQVAKALFGDLPPVRQRELVSAVGHYVAGTLPRAALIEIVESLCQRAALAPGQRVSTLRNTLQGTIVSILPDGRVEWQPDNAQSPVRTLPESLKVLE